MTARNFWSQSCVCAELYVGSHANVSRANAKFAFFDHLEIEMGTQSLEETVGAVGFATIWTLQP